MGFHLVTQVDQCRSIFVIHEMPKKSDVYDDLCHLNEKHPNVMQFRDLDLEGAKRGTLFQMNLNKKMLNNQC